MMRYETQIPTTQEETLILEKTTIQAELCALAYLQEARTTDDPERARELEAIAVKRAVVADQLREITQARTGDGQPTEERPKEPPQLSPKEADRQLFHACEKLHGILTNDESLQQLARQIRLNLSRLGQLPQSHSAQPTGAL